MKKQGWLFLVFVLFLVVAFSILNSIRKCAVESMLLEEDDFPVDTIIDKINSPIADMPINSASIYADYKGSAILHEIARFPSSALAKKEFDGAKRRASGQTDNGEIWGTPDDFSFASSFFESYYVGCGYVLQGKYQCRMIGQYKEYYVFLFAYISEEGLNMAMFETLLQRLDRKMELCLRE